MKRIGTVLGLLILVCVACVIFSQLIPRRQSSPQIAQSDSNETNETLATAPTIPTPTLELTPTPVSISTPTPEPKPIILSGSGPSIIDIDKGDYPAIVKITGNAESKHFAVSSYDASGNQLDLLVNTTEPYSGIRPLDFLGEELTARFEVQAEGNWTITIEILSNADMFEIPGIFNGEGDNVIIFNNEVDTALIKGNASNKHFSIIGYGDASPDLLVNTADQYSGEIILSPDTLVLVVTASGPWSIAIPPDASIPVSVPTKETRDTNKPSVSAGVDDINIRSGPGTEFEIIDQLPANESLDIIGRNEDSSWWVVTTPSGPGWIAASDTTANNVSDSIPLVLETEVSKRAEPIGSSASIQSRGLGLSRAEWEQSHGQPISDIADTFYVYEGNFMAAFLENSHIHHLEQHWDTAISLGDAKVLGELLIPADSQLIETYSPTGRPETTVHVYHSESLKDVIASDYDVWFGSEPGTLILLYTVFEEGVTRIVIGTGNNP